MAGAPQIRVGLPPAQHGKFERELAQRLRLEQQRMLRSVGRRAVEVLQARSPRDLGGYAGGWKYRAAFGYLDLWNAAAHARFVDGGRRPGGMPPVYVISAWAGRKLGRPDLGYVIARAIAKRGVKKRPLLRSRRFEDELFAMVVKAAAEVWDRAARGAL